MKVHYLSLAFTVLLSWGELLLPCTVAGPGSKAVAADILSYSLINADTNLEIGFLAPGEVLDLATLPTRNLNIRANTSDGLVGSVVFTLTGPENRTSTDNSAPYALFGDVQGDYSPWTPPLGSYRLLATPYDDPDGTGTTGAPLTLSFSVISSVAAVATYTLVNADTEADIQPLSPGDIVNLAALPTRNLNIRADLNQLAAGSVIFTLNLAGLTVRSSTENTPPFALFGAPSGNYAPWTPAVGAYTLLGVPFAAPDGAGTVGIGLAVAFLVVDTPLPVQLSAFTAETQGPDEVEVRWSTATEINNDRFLVECSLDGQTFRALGSVAGHGSTSKPQRYRYVDQQLPAQATTFFYRLRQIDLDGTATFSPVRSVVRTARPVAFHVYSNAAPSDKVIAYSYTGPRSGQEVLELYTMLGQLHGRHRMAPSGAGGVSVAGLPPGAYVLRLSSATGIHTGRFAVP